MNDPTDERGVPISSGIPPIVIYAGYRWRRPHFHRCRDGAFERGLRARLAGRKFRRPQTLIG
jgi:hypothetical protein